MGQGLGQDLVKSNGPGTLSEGVHRMVGIVVLLIIILAASGFL